MIGFFRGLSLRNRFLVAPLLGLVVCSLLTAAFVYESHRQNVLLSRITERDLKAFNRYVEVFVELRRFAILFGNRAPGRKKPGRIWAASRRRAETHRCGTSSG